MFDKYEEFKVDVLKLTKIDLNFYKEKQMRRRIDTLATKNGAKSYDEFVQMIKTDKDKFEQFVNFLTINVSEFYRNPDQWKLMDEQVIPKIIKEQKRPIKIWSAACSTGDEPYSLAMAFSKHIPLSDIKIMATDIDKQVIEHAKVGLYAEKSIAAVPDDLKKKYFTKIEEREIPMTPTTIIRKGYFSKNFMTVHHNFRYFPHCSTDVIFVQWRWKNWLKKDKFFVKSA